MTAIIWKNFLQRRIWSYLKSFLKANIYFGKSVSQVPENSLILFPYRPNILYCGITGMIALKKPEHSRKITSVESIVSLAKKVESCSYQHCKDNGLDFAQSYLGGDLLIRNLWDAARGLKQQDAFGEFLQNSSLQREISALSENLQGIVDRETLCVSDNLGRLSSSDVEVVSSRIEDLKDVVWCLNTEVLENLEKTKRLMANAQSTPSSITIFKGINAVLNSIDRLVIERIV